MKAITVKGYKFVALEDVLKEKMKDKRFREGFQKETARLQLAYDIKMLRKQKRMTQKQVAAKAAMPQSVIARIESGNHGFSIATLQRIAGVFNKQVGFVAPARR